MQNGECANLDAKMLSVDQTFNDAFKDIVNELVNEGEADPQLNAAATLLRKCLNYNTFDGKKSRGKMVISTLYHIKKGNATEDEVKKAIYLGWCVEILQALFLVADDIMDKSDMRRGKPCWYKNVGLISINETYLMEQCIFQIIDKHFSGETYLINLYKTFHHMLYLTAMGQELDMCFGENRTEEDTFDSFDMDRYRAIVKYKTAYYSFYLPVCLGMYVAEVKDSTLFEVSEAILLKLGEYFQIQDDYLDCYGDPAVTGKMGRDIEDRKCSWLVVQALQLVSSEQKSLLGCNYGKDDPTAVAVVKDLYETLEIPKLYAEYEEQSYKDICALIESQDEVFPKQLFFSLVHKLYKRKK